MTEEQNLPVESITTHDSEEVMEQFLGLENEIASGGLTPERLLSDVLDNPDKYPEALRPHLASFLGRNGLSEQLALHPDLFKTPGAEIKSKPLEHSYYEPSENSRNVLIKLFGTGDMQGAKSLSVKGIQFTEADALALIDDGYADIFRRFKNNFPPIPVTQSLAQRLLSVDQFVAPSDYDGNFMDEVQVYSPVCETSYKVEEKTMATGKAAADILSGLISSDNEEKPILSEAVARRLIESNNFETVLEHQSQFPTLSVDKKLAEELIEKGRSGARAVAKHVESFSGLRANRTLFERIITAGAGGEALDNRKKFAEVTIDRDIANLLIDTHQLYEVFHYKVFRKVLTYDDALFQRVINSGNIHSLSYYVFDKEFFKDLHAESARLLLEKLSPLHDTKSREEYESRNTDNLRMIGGLLKKPSTFEGFELTPDIATQLIEKNYTSTVLMYVDNFKNLTAEHAEKIIERYTEKSRFGTSLEELISHPETFSGYKPGSTLALKLMDLYGARILKSNYGREPGHTTAFLRAFSELDNSVARRLLFEGLNTGEGYEIGWRIEPDALLNNLDRFHGLEKRVLEVLSLHAGFTVREFPHADVETGKFSRNLQYAWYADHAYEDMGHGWDKTTIGKIIALRLDQVEGENDLHDASQWLSEFRIPDIGYDVSALEALRASGITGEEALEAARVTYFDPALEQDLLRDLLHAPMDLRMRLALPTKDAKLDLLFTSDAHRLIYSAIMEYLRSPDMNFENVQASVKAMLETFYIEQVEQKRINSKDTRKRVTLDDFQEEVRAVLNLLATEEQSTRSITKMIARLHDYGMNRKDYIHDTSGWLLRHATAPNSKLTKVWGDRGLAIAEGISDNLADIIRWQEANAYRLAVHQMDQEKTLPKNMTAEELMGEQWTTWRDEIMRVQSAKNTIEAISKAKRWLAKHGEQPKVVPATNTTIELDGQTYTFEILDARDPRGFTIGEDTACCMTIHGVSNSCIKEGYRNPNAGFMALYDPKGKLLAQSFLYVHPKTPDTVVLDNIEANQGRNFEKITRLYEMGWKKFIADHEHLPIRHVNIGVRYTSVSLDQLKEVNPVPPLNNKIYTDAERQLGLI